MEMEEVGDGDDVCLQLLSLENFQGWHVMLRKGQNLGEACVAKEKAPGDTHETPAPGIRPRKSNRRYYPGCCTRMPIVPGAVFER